MELPNCNSENLQIYLTAKGMVVNSPQPDEGSARTSSDSPTAKKEKAKSTV